MSTLIPEPQNLVRLNVHAADRSTEIYIIDGDFNLAGRGLGELSLDLPPGIYKIKLKSGNDVKEELITLRQGSPTVIRHYEPMSLATPAPLDDTARTHENHIAASVAESQAVHFTAGEGSAIFLFARDWTAGDKRPARRLYPSRGLSLCKANGELVVEYAGLGASHLSQDDDPWCAVNVIVDPGAYRLRLDLPSGLALEQMVYAHAGWQTQVFVLQRQYGPGPEERLADLPGASVLLSRCEGKKEGAWFKGFDQADPQQRLVELARQGLANRRPVLSGELRSLLHGKHQNPMLGIFGAHLLMMEAEPDLDLLQEVTGHLRALIGPHPDVEALRTVLEDSSYVFETPPMLMASWRLVLKASVKHPELAPAHSLASQVATHLWGPEPWLAWMLPAGWEETRGARKKRRLTPEQQHLEKVVLGQLNYAGAPQPAAAETAPAGAVDPGPEPGSPARPRALRSRRRQAPAPPAPPPGARHRPLDEETLIRLVKTTGLPRARLEELVERLDEAGE